VDFLVLEGEKNYGEAFIGESLPSVENLPDHIHLRNGSSSLWISRSLDAQSALRLFTEPDALFSHPQCKLIKDQRKIKVGRIPLEMGGTLGRIYLKRYNAFSWRYRFVSLFASSAALRSWVGAGILMGADFRTGKPVGAVECRSWGMLTKSFYIAEEIPSGSTVDGHWRDKLRDLRGAEGFRQRRIFLGALAALFRSLHEMGIYHNDLKDANIFVCQDEIIREGSFYLLDLEGIRKFRHLGDRRRVKNLVQLNRTMGRMLSNAKKIYFLKTYLGRIFSDGKIKREWIRRINKVSEREDKRSLRKTLG